MKTYQEFINESISHPDMLEDLKGHLMVKAKPVDGGAFELFLVKGENGPDNKKVSAMMLTKGYKVSSSWNAPFTYAVSPRELKKVKAGQYTKI
ncbi:hypothetical protein CJ20_200 [Escherichia phage CJ20]|uniref:Uncharacterized protein VR7ORF153c n=2 Tax=Gaprivervirus TaxID=1913654 RepID=E5FII7_9CAUD|nr:hypothetical protein VR7_gp153 [Escherichia phage vB_EcoM_VR7]YP_009207331.1 hypothetical protein AVV68_gp281 [Escherichia phage vB_EcoM_VR20]QMP18796.1 hypothetical protein CJ20_200 [Escherichia phage CJ20]QQG31059.1 hypothetical protein [Escherichia phage UPEC01]UHS65375.1 hypothetical protein [Escherichia phage P896]ADR32528.1 hypothetical protein VR7_gp153 [Escherichia phage vB_EcoM_VR7]AIZ02210.1 hypothetical protein VR20_152 [Escherichia phage vB_EcoM_VR20]